MTKSEQNLFREVHKNAQMALDAIHAIEDKVYDHEFMVDLNKQAAKYSEMKEQVSNILEKEKAKPEKENPVAKWMLYSGIQMNTLLNTSTSHLAELIIKGTNMGITSLCRAMNHNELAGEYAFEIARELVDFEEANIEQMKKYL